MKCPEIGEIIKIKEGPFELVQGIVAQEKVSDDTYTIGMTVLGREIPTTLNLHEFEYNDIQTIDAGPCLGVVGREYEKVISGKYEFWIKMKKDNGKVKTTKEMQNEADSLRKR